MIELDLNASIKLPRPCAFNSVIRMIFDGLHQLGLFMYVLAQTYVESSQMFSSLPKIYIDPVFWA